MGEEFDSFGEEVDLLFVKRKGKRGKLDIFFVN